VNEACVRLVPAAFEIGQVQFDEPGDGALWARGRTYKASFAPAGATYIPFLGSRAPRNCRVRFALEGARLGQLDLLPARAVVPAREGNTVRYDRGALVEEYELGLDTVEQRFVFGRLPARGDLVVRLGVATELSLTRAEDGLRFGNEAGRVLYGRATALDEAGSRVEVACGLEAGVLELRVPAGFLAGARGAVTIDPIISVFTTETWQYRPSDVAFDVSSNQYLIVTEFHFSETDHDVYASLCEADGTLVPNSLRPIDLSEDFWGDAKVANNNLANQFLVVAVRLVDGVSKIWGRTRQAGSAEMGSRFQISVGLSVDDVTPDVGGDPSLSPPTYYCVTWGRQAGSSSDIWARLVGPDGTLGSTVPVDLSVAYDSRPAISKCDGNGSASSQDWTIVWRRQADPKAQGDIWGSRIHWNGDVTSPSFPIDASNHSDDQPAVSAITDPVNGKRTYLVSFIRGPWPASLCARIFEGTAPRTATTVLREMNTFLTSVEADSDGCRFTVVAAAGAFTTPGERAIYVLHEASFTIGVSSMHESDMITGSRVLGITATRSAGGNSLRCLMLVSEKSLPTGVLFDGPPRRAFHPCDQGW
jgi:hypothetical protein